jgi:hypothetical protein
MQSYELIRTNGDLITKHGTILLPDDARGADLYLRWKKRGYQLRRIQLETTDSDD